MLNAIDIPSSSPLHVQSTFVHYLCISLLFFSGNLILGQMIIIVIPSELPGPKCFSPLARSGISERPPHKAQGLILGDREIRRTYRMIWGCYYICT